MIYISDQLRPELRRARFEDVSFLPYAEERERFYIITSFRCPNQCAFCLFRKEEIKDCPNDVLAAQIERVLQTFPLNFSFSITGGEPLLDSRRLIAVLNAIERNTTPDMVRWVGIGTSGTILPYALEFYPKLPITLYLSRHHYDLERQREGFGGVGRLHRASTYRPLGSHIDVRFSCNLIRGGIDSLDEIKRYLEYAHAHSVKQVTFRELNHVADRSNMYAHVREYADYYDRHVVPLEEVLSSVEQDSDFRFGGQDIRPYIYHERWHYEDIEVCFRRVDEERLITFNQEFPDIDEIVLHPDGLLTGCWDRNQKRLEFAND